MPPLTTSQVLFIALTAAIIAGLIIGCRVTGLGAMALLAYLAVLMLAAILAALTWALVRLIRTVYLGTEREAFETLRMKAKGEIE